MKFPRGLTSITNNSFQFPIATSMFHDICNLQDTLRDEFRLKKHGNYIT